MKDFFKTLGVCSYVFLGHVGFFIMVGFSVAMGVDLFQDYLNWKAA